MRKIHGFLRFTGTDLCFISLNFYFRFILLLRYKNFNLFLLSGFQLFFCFSYFFLIFRIFFHFFSFKWWGKFMVFCVSQVPTFVLFPWIFTFVLFFCCATKISIFFFFLVFSFFLFLFFERNDAACSLRRIFAFYSFRLIFLGFYHLSIFRLPYFRSFIFLVFSFFLFFVFFF